MIGGIEALGRFCEGFQGLRIDYRRSGTDWPCPWRLRFMANKNERADRRITVYGRTLAEVLENGQTALRQADERDAQERLAIRRLLRSAQMGEQA